MYRSLTFSFFKSAALLAAPKPSLPFTSLSSARPFSSAASLVPDPDDQSSADPISLKLEEVIHRIIVRRSAPDWLLFVPGSSYWVPPRRSGYSSLGLVQALERLARPVPDIEPLSAVSTRGWPSPEFLIHGVHPEEMASNEADKGIGSIRFSNGENEEG